MSLGTIAEFTQSRSWKPSKEPKKSLGSLPVKLKAQENVRARWLALRQSSNRLPAEWASNNQRLTCYLVILTRRSYESTRASGTRYGQASLANSAADSRSSMAKTATAELKSTALNHRLRRATIWLMGAMTRMQIRRWVFARGRMHTVRSWKMSANGSLPRRLSKSASRINETYMKFNLSSESCSLKWNIFQNIFQNIFLHFTRRDLRKLTMGNLG